MGGRFSLGVSLVYRHRREGPEAWAWGFIVPSVQVRARVIAGVLLVRTDFLVGLLERHRHARDHSSRPNHLGREKVGDGKKIREKTHRANREGRPWIVMAAGTSEQTRHRGAHGRPTQQHAFVSARAPC